MCAPIGSSSGGPLCPQGPSEPHIQATFHVVQSWRTWAASVPSLPPPTKTGKGHSLPRVWYRGASIGGRLPYWAAQPHANRPEVSALPPSSPHYTHAEVQTHIHTHTHRYTQTQTHRYTGTTYTDMQVDTQTRRHTDTHTHRDTDVKTQTHRHTHAHEGRPTHINAQTHTYRHT